MSRATSALYVSRGFRLVKLLKKKEVNDFKKSFLVPVRERESESARF